MRDTIQNYTNSDMSVTITEFRNDMRTNPLGSGQTLKVVGSCYVIEYYSDSIAGKRLQIWRKALEREKHWRKWLQIADSDDFNRNLRKRFEETSAKICKQFDPMID